MANDARYAHRLYLDERAAAHGYQKITDYLRDEEEERRRRAEEAAALQRAQAEAQQNVISANQMNAYLQSQSGQEMLRQRAEAMKSYSDAPYSANFVQQDLQRRQETPSYQSNPVTNYMAGNRLQQDIQSGNVSRFINSAAEGAYYTKDMSTKERDAYKTFVDYRDAARRAAQEKGHATIDWDDPYTYQSSRTRSEAETRARDYATHLQQVLGVDAKTLMQNADYIEAAQNNAVTKEDLDRQPYVKEQLENLAYLRRDAQTTRKGEDAVRVPFGGKVDLQGGKDYQQALQEFKENNPRWTDEQIESAMGALSRTPVEQYNHATSSIASLSDEQANLLGKIMEPREISRRYNGAGGPMNLVTGRAQMGWNYQDTDDYKAFVDSFGGDIDTAERYIQYASELQDATVRGENQEFIRSATQDGPMAKRILASIGLTGYSIAASPVAGYGGIEETIRSRRYADPLAPVNTNSAANQMSAMSSDIESQISENFGDSTGGKIGRFLYGVGTSTAKSMYSAAIGQGIGSALGMTGSISQGAQRFVMNAVTLPSFGAGAYSSTLEEAQKRGITGTDAVLTAAVSGMAEMATEIVSLDKVWDIMQDSGVKAAKNVIVDAIAQAGIEGSEEVASDLLNLAADAIINANKSEYNQTVQQLMAQGMSEEEAKKQATAQVIAEIGQDFLAGAASGGASGMGANVGRVATGNANSREMFSNGYEGAAEAFAPYLNSADEEIAGYAKEGTELAEKLAEKEKNGEKIKTSERRRLYNLTNEVTNTEAVAAANPEEFSETVDAYAEQLARDKVGTEAYDQMSEKEQTKAKRAEQKEARGYALREYRDAMSGAARVQNERLSEYERNNEESAFDNQRYGLRDVPEDYRTQTNEATGSEVSQKLSAAKTAEELVAARNEGFNSTVENVPLMAERMYNIRSEQMIKDGTITRADLRAAENTPTDQELYLMGANGQEASGLTEGQQVVYNEGRIRRQNDQAAQRVSDNREIQKSVVDGARYGEIVEVGENAKVQTNKGEQDASVFMPESEAGQRLYKHALNMDTPAAANLYLETLPEGAPVASHERYFDEMYNVGRIGARTFEQAIQGREWLVNKYGKDTLQKIYDQGRTDAGRAASETVGQVARKGKGEILNREAAMKSPMIRAMMPMLESLAKKTGLDFALSDTLAENIQGEFNRTLSQIVLNVKSGSGYSTLFHELGEFIKAYDQKAYADIRKAILDYWYETEGNQSANARALRMRETYRRAAAENKDLAAEANKTIEDAADELINDAISGVFATEKSLKAFTNYLSEQGPEGRTLLQKFADFFKAFARTLRSLATGEILSNKSARSLARAGADRANNIRRLFLSGLESATQAYQQTEVGQAQTEQVARSVKEIVVDSAGRELTEGQRQFFRNVSPLLLDENGALKRYYHGTARADRVGTVFDPARATSGPMAFFTDNRSIAENYSKNKVDTSIDYDERYENYFTQFRTTVNGKEMSISDAWDLLPAKKRAELRNRAAHITMDEDYENVIYDEKATNGLGNWDYELRSNKGNVLRALTSAWLESGDLYGNEEMFLDVLRQAGFDQNVEYMDPDARNEGVYEVYLNITNPIDTTAMPEELVSALREASTTAQTGVGNQADMWDKNNISPETWMERLEKDIENGTTHAWTSIPDWVTKVLQEQGYDGIVDQGGKTTGYGHQVVIPFSAEQIKNIDNENPTESQDIRYSVAVSEDGETAMIDGHEAPVIRTNLISEGDILQNHAAVRESVKRALMSLRGEPITIKADGRIVKIARSTAKEYVSSNYTKRADAGTKAVKYSAAQKIRSIVENARNPVTEDNYPGKDNINAERGWTTYDVDFVLLEGESYRVFNGNLIVREDSRGNSYVYDLNKIKEATSVENPVGITPPNTAQSLLSTQNVSQSTQSVNEIRDDIRRSIKDEDLGVFSGDDRYSSWRNEEDVTFNADGSEKRSASFVQQSFGRTTSLIEEGTKIIMDQIDSGKMTPSQLVASEQVARKIARNILRDYKSGYDADTLRLNLQSVFGYLEQGKGINYEELVQLMMEVAEPVLAKTKDTVVGKDVYDAFRKNLSTKEVRLNQQQKDEVAYYYGSYGAFRNAMRGVININDKATSTLDMVWDELVESAQGVLDPETADAQMPLALADAVEALRPQAVSTWNGSSQDMAYDMALDIVGQYFTAQQQAALDAQAKELSAKQKQQIAGRLARVNERLKAEKKAYREQVQNRYKERLAKAREELKGKRDLWKEKYHDTIRMRDERLAEMAAKNRNAMREQRNRRMASQEREEIRKIGKELIDTLNKPSDKKHVPAGMRGPIAEFLKGIDFLPGRAQEGSRPTVAWRDRMSSLQKVLNDIANKKGVVDDELSAFEYTLDPDIAAVLNNFMERNKGLVKLSDLDYEGVHELKQMLRSIQAAIRNADRMIADEHSARVSDLANGTLEDLAGRDDEKARTAFGRFFHNLTHVSMLDSFSYFEGLGPSANRVYRNIRDGFDRRARHLKEAQEWFAGAAKDFNSKDFRNMMNERTTFKGIDGEVRLSTAQVMSLYALMKRQQARDHIMLGGIKSETYREKGRTIEQKRPVHFSKTQLQEMFDTLTPEQVQLADAMQQFMSKEAGSWGNRVTRIMYGYDKFGEENYFPIKSDRNSIAVSDRTEQNDSVQAIRNMSSAQATVQGARNALMVGDTFEVFSNHIADMATYDGFVMPLSDAMRWFNYKYKITTNEGGIRVDTTHSVQEEIDRVLGSYGKQYFTNLMKDINGMTSAGHDSQFADKLLSNFKAAAVGANLRVAIQQPTAYMRAMAMMNPKYMMAALPGAVNPRTLIRYAQKANNNSMIAWWKSQGYFETNLGKTNTQIITGQSTLNERIRDVGAKLAELGDSTTWGTIYHAVELEQKDAFRKAGKQWYTLEDGKKVETEAFTRAVVSRFDDIIDHTQVVDSVLHRSQFMRSKSGLAKLESAFQAEPTKSFNMLFRAFSTKKGRARIVATFAITNLLTAAVASAADAFRYNDDDDKSWLERWLEALFGITGEEGSGFKGWYQRFLNVLTGNLGDQENPLAAIPYVKDAFSVLSGFDSSRSDIVGIENSVKAVQEVLKFVSGDSKKTPYGLVKALSQGFSQLTGVPAYAALREFETGWNTLGDIIGFDHLKTTLESSARKRDYGQLYKAMNSGNGIDKQVTDLLVSGKTVREILSNITTEYKDAWKEAEDKAPIEAAVTSALQAMSMSDGDIQSYLAKWAEENVSYSTMDDAIDAGSGIEDAVQEMLDGGKSAASIASHLQTYYAATLHALSGIDQEDLDDLRSGLKTALDAAGYEGADQILNAWTAGEKPLSSSGSSDYAAMKNAIGSDGDIRAEVNKLLEAGKAGGDIKSTITRTYKDELVELYKTDKTAAGELKKKLISAYMAAGDTRQEANDKINGWFN